MLITKRLKEMPLAKTNINAFNFLCADMNMVAIILRGTSLIPSPLSETTLLRTNGSANLKEK